MLECLCACVGNFLFYLERGCEAAPKISGLLSYQSLSSPPPAISLPLLDRSPGTGQILARFLVDGLEPEQFPVCVSSDLPVSILKPSME